MERTKRFDHILCKKNRNPFRGRRIVTGIKLEGGFCDATFPLRDDVAGHSGTVPEERDNKNTLCGSSMFKKSSKADVQVTESDLLSLLQISLAKHDCNEKSLNMNTNNDCNSVNISKQTHSGQMKGCVSEDNHGTSEQGIRICVNNKDTDENSRGKRKASKNQDNGDTRLMPELLKGVAHVRICDQCVKEISHGNGKNYGILNYQTPADKAQTWTSDVHLKQDVDSDTDFLSCLSSGQSCSKPSQAPASLKEAIEPEACDEDSETPRFRRCRQKPFEATPHRPTSAVFKESGSDNSFLSSGGESKRNQCGLVYPCDTMNFQFARDPQSIETRLPEGRSYEQAESSACRKTHLDFRRDSTMQRYEGKHDVKSDLKHPKDAPISDKDGEKSFTNPLKYSDTDFAVHDKSVEKDSQKKLSNVDTDVRECQGDTAQRLPFEHVHKTNKTIRLIDHLEQNQNSHHSEELHVFQQRMRSLRAFSRNNCSRNTPEIGKYVGTAFQGTRSPFAIKHSLYRSRAELLHAHSKKTALNIHARFDERSVGGSPISPLSQLSCRDRTVRDYSTNKFAHAVRMADNEIDLLGEHENIRSHACFSSPAMSDSHCTEELQSKNTAARLFLRDHKRLLSPVAAPRDVLNVPLCRDLPLHDKGHFCRAYTCRSCGQKRDNNTSFSKEREYGYIPSMTGFRSCSWEFSGGPKRDNTRDTLGRTQSYKCHCSIRKPISEIWGQNDSGLQPERAHPLCERPPLCLYPNLKSFNDESTQTETLPTDVSLALKESKKLQNAATCTTDQELPWTRPTLLSEESSNAGVCDITKNAHPAKPDSLFKPIYLDHQDSTLHSGSERNNARSRSLSDLSPSSKTLGSEGGFNGICHGFPKSLQVNTPSNIPSSDQNSFEGRNRRTLSITTISALTPRDETDQFVARPCRSMSSLMDKNQSSLPHDDNSSSQSKSYARGDFLMEAFRQNRLSRDPGSTNRANSCDTPGRSTLDHRVAHDLKAVFFRGIKGDRNASNTSSEEKANTFIGEYLFNLWENQYLCDVAVTVGGKQMMAHKLVLAAFSDAFCPSSPYTRPSICFDIPDSTPEAVYQIFRYMYTSSMDINDDNLEAALHAALFMGVGEVVDIIKDIIKQPEAHNFQKYARISQILKLPFDVASTRMAREKLSELVQSDYFIKMKFDEISKILEEPNVMVQSEEETVLAVVKWLEGNPEEMPRAHLLLEKVVLESIPPKRLGELMDEHPEVFSECGVLSIMTKAFRRHASKQQTECRPDKSPTARFAEPCDIGLSRRGEAGKNTDATLDTDNNKVPNRRGGYASNNAETNRYNVPSKPRGTSISLTSEDQRVDDERLTSCYEDCRRPYYRGVLMQPSDATSLPNTDDHTFPRTAFDSYKVRNHALDVHCGPNKRSFKYRGGTKTGHYTVGDKSARSHSDTPCITLSTKRGDANDAGTSSITGAINDSEGIKGFLSQNKKLFTSKQLSDSLMSRRWNRLKFLSGDMRAQTSQTNNCASLSSDIKRSRNDNHASGMTSDDSDTQTLQSYPRKRTGEGFWCRPIAVTDNTRFSTSFKPQSANGMSQLSEHNNNTNNRDNLASSSEGRRAQDSGRPFVDRRRRSCTPSQLTRKRKSEWKKRFWRLQNKALLRYCYYDRSAGMHAFEKIRSKGNWQSRHLQRKTGFPTDPGSPCRYSIRHQDHSNSEDTGNRMIKRSQLLEKSNTVPENEPDFVQDRHVVAQTKNVICKSVLSVDKQKSQSQRQSSIDRTRRYHHEDMQPVDVNKSLSILDHDDRTSAFKKFVKGTPDRGL